MRGELQTPGFGFRTVRDKWTDAQMHLKFATANLQRFGKVLEMALNSLYTASIVPYNHKYIANTKGVVRFFIRENEWLVDGLGGALGVGNSRF